MRLILFIVAHFHTLVNPKAREPSKASLIGSLQSYCIYHTFFFLETTTTTATTAITTAAATGMRNRKLKFHYSYRKIVNKKQ
jgi:drug/metabolite transporter (DMT)-like permease